jgi:hypothetical protein
VVLGEAAAVLLARWEHHQERHPLSRHGTGPGDVDARGGAAFTPFPFQLFPYLFPR